MEVNGKKKKEKYCGFTYNLQQNMLPFETCVCAMLENNLPIDMMVVNKFIWAAADCMLIFTRQRDMHRKNFIMCTMKR